LRRIILSNGSRHTADVRIAHVRKQKEVSQPAARAAPLAKFAITMRYQGKERTTDIPSLPSAAIEALALEAMSRDLSIAALIGRVLVAVIDKDMIRKILPDEVPPLRPNTSSHFSFLIATVLQEAEGPLSRPCGAICRCLKRQSPIKSGSASRRITATAH
jgi:hypothetical protein